MKIEYRDSESIAGWTRFRTVEFWNLRTSDV
jgi:hypothetical protein